MPKLRITWLKSDIGYDKTQKATIKALGFHHLNESVEKEDTRGVRGMVNKVRHLLLVEEGID